MASVFISHSAADKEAALRLRALLAKNEFQSLFLDSEPADGIIAGSIWERELYMKLRACRALIALSSENYVASRWCFAEVAQARALGKKVFPLNLDGSPLHPLLVDTQAIDWRNDGEGDAFGRLRRGLEQAGIARGSWDRSRSPYPGLLSFEEQDAAIFFGREQLVEDILSKLARLVKQGGPRWLTLCGPSGSGKSSVLRAGLIPRLRRDHAWIVVGAFRRGMRALESLSLAVAAEFKRVGKPRSAQQILGQLQSGSAAAYAQLASELRLATERPAATVLIVPDHSKSSYQRLLGEAPRPKNSGAQSRRLCSEACVRSPRPRTETIASSPRSAPTCSAPSRTRPCFRARVWSIL